jgi:1D-myo-inositol 3-kinase
VPPTFAGTFRSGENAGVPCDVLLVGHYTHDLLRFASGDRAELGGSSAYASAVFDAFQIDYRVVAYAGADFRYADRVRHAPRILEGARTTSFVDDYRRGERTATLLAAAPPIDPADLVEPCRIAIACGVAGEIGAAVVTRLRELSDVVLVDAQAVVRSFGADGRVELRTPGAEVLDALADADWIKGSRDELAALSAAQLDCGLIVTDGPRGCSVVHAGAETRIEPFTAREVDPTGAGDCLLAGFAAGLSRGWDPVRAARFGAYCGAMAVQHHGVPRFTATDFEAFW